ncbi:MAG: AAA family ATPase [Oscillospiraceae bacterium]|nr:AAA family ATPase [Oscillospiraceae bacterium]
MSAFVGADRKINENPATNRWTLLGRLLRDINDRFMEETLIDENGVVIKKSEKFKEEMQRIRDDILYSVTDDEGENLMHQFIEILQCETASQLGRTPSDFNVDLNTYDPWNLFRTLQIMVNEADTNMTFRASELGMGVQASITIAILKAYSRLKLKNSTPIIIDEPELFLHPQGRRNFYKIICQLADSGTQVILTTHSSEFISLARFNEIFVVRKDKEHGTYVRYADPNKFVDDLMIRHPKVKTNTEELMLEYLNAYEGTGDSQRASEAMFARKAILVEGESEVLILPYFFQLLDYDYISKGITIVRCGGKSEIDRFYRLYSEFGIPCYIIFDGDSQNIGHDDEKATIDKNHGILRLFGCKEDFPNNKVNDRYLGFEYRLEENLNIKDIGKSKAVKLYRKVKSSIVSKDKVPSWVSELIDKVEQLPTEAESVLYHKENNT